jgi:hypothetical protein
MLAGLVIQDISSSALTCSNQLCGWNAVRILFEAVLIPILAHLINEKSGCGITSNTGPFLSQVEIAITALASLHAWSPTAPQTLSYVWRIYGAIDHFSSPHVPSDLHITESAMISLFTQSPREGHGTDPDINVLHDPDVATWTRHSQGFENMDFADPSSILEYLQRSTQSDENLAWFTEEGVYMHSI